ncbi:hypothetical protein A8L34_26920 [Bacillus sp. FJAT-27264]|uniref:hypothetical protein n=1 Tax=Paenibacillus sp. (strain DSM 101736 / FJAT-27264) TaxID=1850362 RepID=UPI000807A98E|nr:hypothetical protein [Bacillus sp. FJAT-27264]OBZ16314.1 hypothetical protein A8L34_26920 [Bacillus sp. FJAT-27264]
MKNYINNNEYQIRLPYIGAKYAAFFSMMGIFSILIHQIWDLEQWKEFYIPILIVLISVVGVSMIKEIRKERSIVITDNNVIIDGVSLEANEIKYTKINKYFIEFETSKKRWSQRVIRFDFKGIEKETQRNELKTWLRRKNITIK